MFLAADHLQMWRRVPELGGDLTDREFFKFFEANR
jgi:hypothetical protein